MVATATAPTTVALADDRTPMVEALAYKITALGFNPIELGVRNATSQGPDTLRHYVQRTQAIYNFSYWDFAKCLPRE